MTRARHVLACALLVVLVEGAAAKPRSRPVAPRSTAAGSPSVQSRPVSATGRPDFTGTWSLDPARSEFGKFPGGNPTARTDVIEHRGTTLRQTLHLERGAKRDTTRYGYATDSTRCVNRVAGQDIEAWVWWQGSVLRLSSRTSLMGLPMSLEERWTLSPDRNALTMARHVKYPMGEGDQTLTFVRR